MTISIPPQYDPHDHEKKIYAAWEKSGSFSPREGKREPNLIAS